MHAYRSGAVTSRQRVDCRRWRPRLSRGYLPRCVELEKQRRIAHLSATLASAGVGRLGIVDYDTIALDNLHRQVLHAESNVGGSKAQSIADAVQRFVTSHILFNCAILTFLCRVNSSVSVKVHEVQLCADNVLDIVRQYDVVVDCSDNAPTRFVERAYVLLDHNSCDAAFTQILGERCHGAFEQATGVGQRAQMGRPAGCLQLWRGASLS